ncbi:unnamed protein product, partial [Meganyctiphanes norvegica]
MAQQPLPEGWEARFDQRANRYYFVDHRTHVTSWVDPRQTSANLIGASVGSNFIQQQISGILSGTAGSSNAVQANANSSGSYMGLGTAQPSTSLSGLAYPVAGTSVPFPTVSLNAVQANANSSGSSMGLSTAQSSTSLSGFPYPVAGTSVPFPTVSSNAVQANA